MAIDVTEPPRKIPHVRAELVQPSKVPTFEEFRAAVKYILVHDNSMPELVAEEILSLDETFLEGRRQMFSRDEQVVLKTAESLMYEPPKGVEWVRLEKGMRTAGSGDVVLELDGKLEQLLDTLVELGLYGESRDAAAKAMLVRGIEAVYSLIRKTK